MVKADLRKPETDTWKADIGGALEQAVAKLGWSLKEFAGHIERDERQASRWLTGAERPQLDRIFAVKALRLPFILAMAELAGEDIEIETTIRLRRRA